MHFKQKLSTNYSKRVNNLIDTIVIHSISLPPKKFNNNFVEDFFTNNLDFSIHPYFENIKHLKVSAHLFIKRSGQVIQFVEFKNKAWHAGVSSYKGRDNINEYSIGVEMEGANDINYTNKQYVKLNLVLAYLIKIYPIKYIVGHSDISPARKSDPGHSFRWDKLLNGVILDEYR